MPNDLFDAWATELPKTNKAVTILVQKPGTEQMAVKTIRARLAAHYISGAAVISKRGFAKVAAVLLKNSLPTNKKTRSGDLGELLAAEYLNARTSYSVPIFKLNWKSDRETALHGNDVIAIDT